MGCGVQAVAPGRLRDPPPHGLCQDPCSPIGVLLGSGLREQEPAALSPSRALVGFGAPQSALREGLNFVSGCRHLVSVPRRIHPSSHCHQFALGCPRGSSLNPSGNLGAPEQVTGMLWDLPTAAAMGQGPRAAIRAPRVLAAVVPAAPLCSHRHIAPGWGLRCQGRCCGSRLCHNTAPVPSHPLRKCLSLYPMSGP